MSESSFRSPFAALVWKEWRESWWLLVLTSLGAAASYLVVMWAEWPMGSEIVGLWLLGLSLGAGLFAGERANGTALFQAERPVNRGMIWNAKLSMPLLALAAGEILYVLVAFALWPTPDWHAGGAIETYMLLGAGFLAFASAVLSSVLVDRTVTAWAAGGVLSVVAVISQALLFERSFGFERVQILILFLCLLLLEAIGLLWLSRVAYVRWAHD